MKRIKYPRPNMVRNEWQNLNGEWDFCFDQNYSLKNVKFDKKIKVPFVYQSEESGLGIIENHDYVWYKKEFKLDYKMPKTVIHFGAVDYECFLYVNNKYVGKHVGGSTPFSFDITDVVKDENEIILKVYDPSFDESIPRGKQYWKEESEAIWYTKSTGIWQTVWLEFLNHSHVNTLKFTPNIDDSTITFDLKTIGNASKLEVEIKKDKKILIQDTYNIVDTDINRTINLLDSHIFRTNFHNPGWLWYPESPALFDVKIKLWDDGLLVDEVISYFGMRKVHFKNGKFYLNNRPYYQKLILDQGYWPTGLLTAPTDISFEEDIILSKKMGFNGCRKHQKVEDPQFLYECDRLGYLVWSEIPSAPIFNDNSAARMLDEYREMMMRDYNHPSIVVWVCLNESWTVPKIAYDKSQQALAQSLYYLTKTFDQTRLSISNDGWTMTETDICALHNYGHGFADEVEKYEKFKSDIDTVNNLVNPKDAGFPTYANGYSHKEGTPIMLTEFGGIAYATEDSGNKKDWGYTSAKNAEEFVSDLERVMKAVYASEALHGFCYTQLTDVEQEINGLLNYDRSEKVSLDVISKIIKNEN